MSITRTSVKRPLTIIMVFVIVLLFGIIGYLKMPSNIMPDIDIPVVMVQTTWQGAGPEDIDKEVSKPIEKALSSVQGVKNNNFPIRRRLFNGCCTIWIWNKGWWFT